MTATLPFYNQRLQHIVDDATNFQELQPLLKSIPLTQLKQFIGSIIMESNESSAQSMYFKSAPITDILPNDAMQTILSFGSNLKVNNLINKTVTTLSSKNDALAEKRRKEQIQQIEKTKIPFPVLSNPIYINEGIYDDDAFNKLFKIGGPSHFIGIGLVIIRLKELLRIEEHTYFENIQFQLKVSIVVAAEASLCMKHCQIECKEWFTSLEPNPNHGGKIYLQRCKFMGPNNVKSTAINLSSKANSIDIVGCEFYGFGNIIKISQYPQNRLKLRCIANFFTCIDKPIQLLVDYSDDDRDICLIKAMQFEAITQHNILILQSSPTAHIDGNKVPDNAEEIEQDSKYEKISANRIYKRYIYD